MRVLQIDLLGDFRLRYGDEPITSVNTPRLQSLLAYLLLHRQAPQSRQHIAFQFWPDSSEKQAHTNLRKLLFQLRNALPDADRFLLQDHLTVQWRLDAAYTLDVAELQIPLARCLTTNGKPSAQANLDDLTKVVNLYQGTLLPGCFDEWLLPLRQQLQRDVVQTLEQLISLSEHQREYRAGIRYAQQLLGLDPLHETGYRRLMQLQALNGDRAAALHHYHTCVTLLQQELGVEPDEETRALYQRILKLDGQPVQPVKQLFDAPLVGRTAEWATLLASWRQVQRGQVHFVLVAGEAGMGKTRLAEELLTWVSAQGMRVARTRSYEAEGGLAYAPVTEWLRANTMKPALKQLDKIWLSEVARLLPELLTDYPQLSPPAPLTETWQRQRFFEALARAMLVEQGPLLLLIDDLHWCDQETLAWLHYLLHFAPHARLLVVGTSRVEEVDDAHPLTTLRLGLRREALITEIELTPLSAAEVTALAREVADDALTVAQTNQLYIDTEGNPLFVVETVRAGLGKGSAAWGGAQTVPPTTPLPPSVYTVIRTRLTRLSPQAQKIASLAAVIGRSFTYAVITAAAHADEDTIIASLDELWARRIVREQGSEGYDFSHDRMRDVAYAELSRARRRQLHRHVAEALETVYAGSLDEISGRLAEHYEQTEDRTKTIYYLQRAGERSLAQFAHASAVDYGRRALVLLPPTDYATRFSLLLTCVRIANHQGKRTEAQRDLESLQQIVSVLDDGTSAALRRQAEVMLCVADYGRGLGDDLAIGTAAQAAIGLAEQCGANDLAARAYFFWAESNFWQNDTFVEARAQLEKAIIRARAAGLQQTAAEALSMLGLHSLYSGVLFQQIETELQQSLALYQQIGDPAGQAGALGMLAYLIYRQREGGYAQGIRYCEQALQLPVDGWDAERFVVGNLGFLWYYQGDYARARPLLERQLFITQQVQNWGPEAGATLELGCLYEAQGDYVNAQIHLEKALQLYRANGSTRQHRVVSEGLLALHYHALGEHGQANVHGEAAVAFARTFYDPRTSGDAHTRWGRVLVALGQLDQAAELFHQALADFRQTEQVNHTLMPIAGLAEIALRQGDSAQARQWAEQILTHLQTHQLDCTQEELYVYMTCYTVMKALQDPRAATLLRLAHAQLQVCAASLGTDEERHTFWSAPPYAAVLTAIAKG